MMSQLAVPMDATGDYKTLGSNSAPHMDLEKKLIDEDATTCTATISATKESTLPTYLDELLDEKARLKKPDGQFKHIIRLINAEISRLLQASDGNNNNNSDRVKRVTLIEKILVPVDKYPNYNFVGRILGPRGMTARQLEEETGCKILVRGRGNQARTEPLHIIIQCEDIEEIAEEKMKYAIERVHVLLHPPPEGKDELKRKQLIELSIINGTYRPTTATKNGLQVPRSQMMPFGGVISPEYLTPLSPEKPSKMSPEKGKVDTYEQYKSMMPMDPFVSGTPESSNMFRQLLDLQPSLSATSYTNPLFAALSSIYSSASIPQGNAGHLLQALSMLNVQPYPKGH